MQITTPPPLFRRGRSAPGGSPRRPRRRRPRSAATTRRRDSAGSRADDEFLQVAAGERTRLGGGPVVRTSKPRITSPAKVVVDAVDEAVLDQPAAGDSRESRAFSVRVMGARRRRGRCAPRHETGTRRPPLGPPCRPGRRRSRSCRRGRLGFAAAPPSARSGRCRRCRDAEISPG